MNDCACEANDKVIPFPGRAIKKGESTSQVDQAVLKALERRLNETAEKSNEIVVFDHDIRAIENEEVFRKRFGFALGRRGRTAMFEVIDQYDLTDGEVRRLYRAGCVRWDGKTLQISANKLFLYTGWIYYSFIALIVLFCAVAFVFADRASATGRLTLLGITTAGFVAMIILRRDFIAPHYLKQQRASPTPEK